MSVQDFALQRAERCKTEHPPSLLSLYLWGQITCVISLLKWMSSQGLYSCLRILQSTEKAVFYSWPVPSLHSAAQELDRLILCSSWLRCLGARKPEGTKGLLYVQQLWSFWVLCSLYTNGWSLLHSEKYWTAQWWRIDLLKSPVSLITCVSDSLLYKAIN